MPHLNSFNINPPGIGCLVETDLHVVGDRLTLGEDVAKGFRAKDVPVRRTSELGEENCQAICGVVKSCVGEMSHHNQNQLLPVHAFKAGNWFRIS